MKCQNFFKTFFSCDEVGHYLPTSTATGLGLSQRGTDWPSPLRGGVSSGWHAQTYAGSRATADGVFAVRRQ